MVHDSRHRGVDLPRPGGRRHVRVQRQCCGINSRLIDLREGGFPEVAEQGSHIAMAAAVLEVTIGGRQEGWSGLISLNLGGGVASMGFDAFLDLAELLLSDGSFRSSAASFHSDVEVFASDFPIRRFARPWRAEIEGHG